MRKVLYVTGTRADYGLMASTLARISAHPALSAIFSRNGESIAALHSSSLPTACRLVTMESRLARMS